MSRSYLIVGGGAAGALLGIHLSRAMASDDQLILIEPAAEVGSGFAYSTPFEGHLLNVPAGAMSAFDSSPESFVDWIVQNKPGAGDRRELVTRFVSRHWFGEYLGEVFERECVRRLGVRFRHLKDAAIGARRDLKWHLRLSRGSEVEGDVLVLATGNSRPNLPVEISDELRQSSAWIGNPFDLDRLKKISSEAPVAILGTGLTMIDVYLALRAYGHTGPVTAFSRKGLFPRSHGASSVRFSSIAAVLKECTVVGLLRQIREQVRLHTTQGGIWQDVLTAFRPHASKVWLALSEKERRRFLRHLRPYWEVHRHRTLPAHQEILQSDLRSGELKVIAGRLSPSVLSQYPAVINATGQSDDLRSRREPLIESLVSQKLAAPDPLGLGLDTRGTPDLYALGTLTRGLYWEITAIPEIRKQTETLAQALTQS